MTLDELMDLVKKKGYGTSQYDNIDGDTVYLSCGVRQVFLEQSQNSKIVDFVRAFRKGDFGTAAEFGKNQRPGHEYGRYETREVEAQEGQDAGVWVHRAEDALIVYFSFER